MRIQFGAYIKNRFGEDFHEVDPRTGQLKRISLGDVCCAVLDAQMSNDSDAKDKVRRWELIKAITKAEKELRPLEVLDSDLETIKDRLLKSSFSASVCGCAMQLLTAALELPEDEGPKDASSRRPRAA